MSGKLFPEPERLYPTARWRPDKPKTTRKDYIRDLREAVRSLFFNRIQKVYEGKKGSGKNIAIYVHYSSSRFISKMVKKQVETYASLGFEIVFVSVSREILHSELIRMCSICRTVCVRRNVGHDFGAWRDVLASDIIKLDDVEELLLVNDSILGPIRPIEPLFEIMRRREGLWGLTNSRDYVSHLQSYFLLARGREAVEAVGKFMQKVTIFTQKDKVIWYGELQLTQSIASKGVPVYSLYGLDLIVYAASVVPRYYRELALSLGFPLSDDEEISENTKLAIQRFVRKSGLNPTHHLAEPLVRIFDFPFLKKDLIASNPCNMTIGANWRSLIDEASPCSVEILIDHLCHFSYERLKKNR
ncbi:rhamnan synthesis F family protein [uncultured Rhodoblastus sp.]|uniref:rhamnan synthesis F family protein n=1 Tax=uncultured Rhodoblastus sp. TaxID=543037 RepID=UPI0025D9B87B|nr:rhamnan synthesis F family protein [uncultured Rhodoblastus sp.]